MLPLAEQAVATGQVEAVYELLAAELRRQLEQRLRRVGELAAAKDRSVADARAWVEAMLGFEVYAHHTYTALQRGPRRTPQRLTSRCDAGSRRRATRLPVGLRR